MKSVLFVCLGNICRSPMAHGILRDKAEKANIDVEIESAGTSGFHLGEPADSRAISMLQSKGIDILDLRSRLFIAADFDTFDYIFTMDSSNQLDLLNIRKDMGHPNYPQLVMNLSYPTENISVPDPYYGGATGFEDVYKMLDGSLDELIKKLQG